MPRNGYRSKLSGSQMAGVALSNTTTPTNILPGGSVFTIPANYLEYPGLHLKLELWGIITSPATPAFTLTLDCRMGSTAVFATQAITLNASAMTNETWKWDVLLRLNSIDTAAGGATAAFIGCSEWKSRALVGSAAVGAGGVGVLLSPETSPAAGTGFDMAASNAFSVNATWSGALATYSIQTLLATLESLD